MGHKKNDKLFFNKNQLMIFFLVIVEEEEEVDVDQVDTQDLMPLKMKWVRPLVMFRCRGLL